MTSKRMCISVTPEFEQKIVDYRKKPGYERMSLSEIVRVLVQKALDCEKEESK